jgi:hypothetical protein
VEAERNDVRDLIEGSLVHYSGEYKAKATKEVGFKGTIKGFEEVEVEEERRMEKEEDWKS